MQILKKTWLSKLGCHLNVNVDVYVTTTLGQKPRPQSE